MNITYQKVMNEIKKRPISTRALAIKLKVDRNFLSGYLIRLEEEEIVKKVIVGHSYFYEVIK